MIELLLQAERTLAMGRLDAFDDFACLGQCAQGVNQQLRSIDRKPERLEELRLPAVVGMSRVQQIVDDLVSFDDGELRVSQFQRTDAILPRASALSSPDTSLCFGKSLA